ncbi:MAG: bacillithiol biosynthesis cysteine-adding enzyme BshC [Bernardetiaceae bacterium]
MFKHVPLPLAETGHFSTLLTHYLEAAPQLKKFYGHPPHPDSFLAQIQSKSQSFTAPQRQTLVEALQRQYSGLPDAPHQVMASLCDPKTFVLTTGHQLNIFSGPLYFHYKIITVINAAQQLQACYPDYRFVPVYWMASEDHDIAEIRSFQLFGKQWTWETTQQGPVGRFAPNGIGAISEQIGQTLSPFSEAYAAADTLAAATRRYVHALYGDQGLLVVDGDEASLKAAFVDVMRQDLFEHRPYHLVQSTTEDLVAAGYKDQIFVRPINLFYLMDGLRERIERQGEDFVVLNTDLRFSAPQLEDLLRAHPERFSPNVVLRPLYQEMILPNLSYTGGPAEIGYWLQLKGMFDGFGVPFPVLLPRNFVLFINKTSVKKMEKVGLTVPELFLPTHQIKRHYVEEQAGDALDLAHQREAIAEVFAQLAAQADQLDPSLVGWVKAQETQVQKMIDKVAQRFRKAEEQKHQIVIRQINTLKEKLFPEGGLQERHENVLSFLLNDPDFLRRVQERLDAFDARLHVLIDE